MSDGAAQLLALWQRYAQEGASAFEAIFTADILVEEWEEAPGAQAWHGIDGVHALQRRWESDLEGFRFEATGPPAELASNVLALPIRAVGRGRASGVDIDWALWMVCELREQRIAWVAYARDLDQARMKLRERRSA